MSLTRELLNKNVRRNKTHDPVIDLLVWGKKTGAKTEIPIFSDIKDLIIFAAMVGKRLERKESIEKDNVGITLQTFSGGGGKKGSRVDQHNLIFLFGLVEHKDMNMVRDERVDDSIKLFEEYSNGGLRIIHDWLVARAWDPLILLDKLNDELNQDGEAGGIDVPDNPF